MDNIPVYKTNKRSICTDDVNIELQKTSNGIDTISNSVYNMSNEFLNNTDHSFELFKRVVLHDPCCDVETPLALPDGLPSSTRKTQAVLPSQTSSCSSASAPIMFTDTKLSRPVNYEIVLYRDRRLVAYSSTTRQLHFCTLSSNKESTLRNLRFPQCPLCGQVVDPSNFSFEAQSYFTILQNMWITHVFFNESKPRSRDLLMEEKSEYQCTRVLPNDEAKGFSQEKNVEFLMNPFVDDEIKRCTDKNSKKNHDNQSVLTGMCITGYYASFFQEISCLGSGSYGQVYLCHHYLDEVFIGEYAVKKVPVGQDRRWLQSVLREVKIREKLHHANIVEYKHSWLEMHHTSPLLPVIPWLFVLMEFCNAGDLDSFLVTNHYVYRNSKGASCTFPKDVNHDKLNYMKESFIWKLFFDIANGLNHLHHSGILHRDLKPQNILLHCTLNSLLHRPETSAMLSDFGTSELLADKVQDRHGFTGTVEFTAPELLETDEKGCFREDYDEKSDIWSLGIVLYLMAFGHVPYFDSDPQKCRLQILKHTDPHLIIPQVQERSTDLILLLEALLQRDPHLRPSLDTIMQHPRIRRRLVDTDKLAEVGVELSYILERNCSKSDGDANVSSTSKFLNKSCYLTIP